MIKVLFRATNLATFRATSIGYLHEIAQKHNVVLLTEEIDEYTKKLLYDKKLFPGLEKIIFYESPFHGNIIYKNYCIYRELKKTMQDWSPDIVIANTDIWPVEMYLLRLAKRAGITTIVIQSGFKIAGQRDLYMWSCLMNSYGKMPGFLPASVRMFLVKVKKYLGYFVYHWIFPLTVGETPFFGKTSFIFWYESSGSRDADYSAIFSKRDYRICIKDGVSSEKLFVIGHPLEHAVSKIFFEKTYFAQNKKADYPSKADQKILTIMWSEEKIGFREQDYSLISAKEMRENRASMVKLISKKLPDWRIFIKPHPALKNILEVQELIGQIPENVSIVEPSESADTYIEMSSVIVGMPPPSTTLFTAAKQNSQKIILSLNLHGEFLGNAYKDFNGIEYIENEEKFIRTLDSIRKGIYKKENNSILDFDFVDAAELVNYAYEKRIS